MFHLKLDPDACHQNTLDSNQKPRNITVQRCDMQVVQILTGDLSCIRGTRKIQVPFLRRAFREELFRAEQPRLRDVLMEHS